MCPSKNLPRRKSLRLRDHDYAAPGGYFVTICTQGKRCVFGRIEAGKMQLNPAGQAVQQAWLGLPQRFPSLYLDTFVVMPNHMHGVLVFVGAGLAPPAAASPITIVGAKMLLFANSKDSAPAGVLAATSAGGASPAPTGRSFALRDVVRAFKSISTIAVNRAQRRRGVQLWQRNYYEHIVRNGDDLDNIRRYVFDNPLRWDLDPENPAQPVIP